MGGTPFTSFAKWGGDTSKDTRANYKEETCGKMASSGKAELRQGEMREINKDGGGGRGNFLPYSKKLRFIENFARGGGVREHRLSVVEDG